LPEYFDTTGAYFNELRAAAPFYRPLAFYDEHGPLAAAFRPRDFRMGDVLSQGLRISTRQDQVRQGRIRRDKGESRRRIVSRRTWWIGFVVCCALLLSWGAPLLAQAQPPAETETEPDTASAVIEG